MIVVKETEENAGKTTYKCQKYNLECISPEGCVTLTENCVFEHSDNKIRPDEYHADYVLFQSCYENFVPRPDQDFLDEVKPC